MQTGPNPQRHRRGMGGFGEEATHRIPKYVLQPKAHSPGAAPDPARQVHHQRMFLVDPHLQGPELTGQPVRGRGIPREQGHRVLVIHKVHARIGLRFGPPGVHRLGEVPGMFHHAHAPGTQQLLLPGARVGGHVHGGAQPQRGGRHPDGKTQVSGGADHDSVIPEHLAHVLVGEPCVVVRGFQHPGIHHDPFGHLQHLVDPAAGLDRTGHRQHVVPLHPQLARQLASQPVIQLGLQVVQSVHRGFDDAVADRGFRELAHEPGGEALKPPSGVLDQLGVQPAGVKGLRGRGVALTEPQCLLALRHGFDHRVFQQLVDVECHRVRGPFQGWH